MQQIVTPDYYKDVFCGEFDGDEKEMSKLLEVAYIIIYNEYIFIVTAVPPQHRSRGHLLYIKFEF